MAMSGDLSSVNLADIFQMLSMSQEKQVLSIQLDDETKHFIFASNSISLALNQKKMGPIGQLLVHLGKITEDQLNQALLDQQQNGGRVGEAIMRLGFATQHEVEAVFRMQMEEEIYDVLEGKRGSFKVNKPEQVDLGDANTVMLSFDVMSVLMEAARRGDEWQTIRASISSMDDIYAKTSKFNVDVTDTSIPALRRTLAKYIDGTYTVRGLIEKLMLPRFEILSNLNELYAANMLKRLNGHEMTKVAEAYFKLGKEETGFRILERAGQLDPSNPELIEKVASTYINAGRKKDGARHYETLATYLVNAGDHDGALQFATLAIKADRYNVPMRVLIFTKSLEQNKLTEAINSARYLEVHYKDKQEWDNAVNVCLHVLNAQPDNAEFRAKLIDLYLEMNDMNQALEQCEQLEAILTKDNLQMIKIYKKVLARFPGQSQVIGRLTTLTKKHRQQKVASYALIIAVLASGAAGVFFTLYFYDQIDILIHL